MNDRAQDELRKMRGAAVEAGIATPEKGEVTLVPHNPNRAQRRASGQRSQKVSPAMRTAALAGQVQLLHAKNQDLVRTITTLSEALGSIMGASRSLLDEMERSMPNIEGEESRFAASACAWRRVILSWIPERDDDPHQVSPGEPERAPAPEGSNQ
jgi:hypothetical protein